MKKRILITGGSRGIGKCISNLLREDESIDIVAPPRQELNLTDKCSIEAFFKAQPPFNGLVNAAGINILGEIASIDDSHITQMLDTNLVAPLKLIQRVVDGMKMNKGGKIVNISSIWGVRSKEKRTLYSMTKFGVEGLTRALARELGPFNILINSIAPGYVLTEMTYKNIPADERERLCSEIPLRRMANPSEIAHLVKFLLSDENTYMTGQNIIIDGGFLA
jgi:3-oxoacyl-[acyl-carrier protein] reductase